MDTRRIFDDAIGAPIGWSERAKHHAIADLLTRNGHEVGPKTVEKWATRENIPGRWIFAIARAVRAEGRQIDLNTYV
jgi:hypothetical protein